METSFLIRKAHWGVRGAMLQKGSCISFPLMKWLYQNRKIWCWEFLHGAKLPAAALLSPGLSEGTSPLCLAQLFHPLLEHGDWHWQTLCSFQLFIYNLSYKLAGRISAFPGAFNEGNGHHFLKNSISVHQFRIGDQCISAPEIIIMVSTRCEHILISVGLFISIHLSHRKDGALLWFWKYQLSLFIHWPLAGGGFVHNSQSFFSQPNNPKQNFSFIEQKLKSSFFCFSSYNYFYYFSD